MIGNTCEFHKRLLDALESISLEYVSLNDPAAQKKLLLKTCREVGSREVQIVGENLVKILEHYIQTDAIDYDWVFAFVQQKVNSEIDDKMMKREQKDDFDTRFNTLTGVILSQYELPDEVDVQRYESANRYNPSPIVSVNMALDKLPGYQVNYGNFVFMDIGSGMGRNLLLASAYPFHEIIGVELSHYLHTVAESNLARYPQEGMQCRNFRLECVNAAEFVFPEKDMVLYFWYPFDEQVAQRFLKNLEDFLEKHPVWCILLFLENHFECVGQSAVFRKIDSYPTPATTINDEKFFSITVFSNK
jgi:hypothetical protein